MRRPELGPSERPPFVQSSCSGGCGSGSSAVPHSRGRWASAQRALPLTRSATPEAQPITPHYRATRVTVTSVITINIDPTIEIGPITVAWHGLTIAIGIVVGGLAAAYDARRRGFDPERVYAIGMILVIGALVGGRAFYLLESSTTSSTTPARGWAPPGSPSTAASSPPRSASPTTSAASG